MTEITRAPYPAEPIASPIVAEWHELRNAYSRSAGHLERLIPLPERGYNSPDMPDPNYIGTTTRERSWSIESDGGYSATDEERLALLRQCADEQIARIGARILLAEKLAKFFATHRMEIESHLDERATWAAACREIDDAYSAAKLEESRDRERARFKVGAWVKPYRARNAWEIIARNGNGAILREIRYDDKPARVQEVADVYGLDIYRYAPEPTETGAVA